jgi:methyl-accepting chemotaxis protein
MLTALETKPIRTQLLAGSLVAALLFMVGNAVGLQSLRWSHHEIGKLFNVSQEYSVASQLTLEMRSSLLLAREYLATRDRQDLNQSQAAATRVRHIASAAQKNMDGHGGVVFSNLLEIFAKYETGLDTLGVLMQRRDQIVKDILDVHGPKGQQLLAAAVDGALSRQDYEAASAISATQEDFLTARLHAIKFLLNNNPQDALEVEKEFEDLSRSIVRLQLRGGENSRSSGALNMQDILELVDSYRLAFSELQKVISERNIVRTETLDKNGTLISEMASKLTEYALKMEVETADSLSSGAALRLWIMVIVVGLGLILGTASAIRNASSIARRISRVTAQMRKLVEGDYELQIEETGEKTEFGEMARALVIFRDSASLRQKAEADLALNRRQADAEREAGAAIQSRTRSEQEKLIAAVGKGLSSLANGELNYRLSGSPNDGYRQIYDDFNRTADHLIGVVERISGGSDSVKTAIREINLGVVELAGRTEIQASSLEETSSAMEELLQTVRLNAQNAQSANKLAAAARDLATNGGQIATQAVTAMSRIEQSSQQVTDITGLIQEIAFQTNILALNAAVEAARAGEAGRGFAVVASEVRALAQRTAHASKDIKGLIGTTDQSVKEGSSLVKQAGASLTDIVDAARQVADIISSIASASQEQATGIEEMNKAIASMDGMTQQNAALVEETNAALQSADIQMSELQSAVGYFKLPRRQVSDELETQVPPLPAAEDGNASVISRLHKKLSAMTKTMSTGKASPQPQLHDWNEF